MQGESSMFWDGLRSAKEAANFRKFCCDRRRIAVVQNSFDDSLRSLQKYQDRPARKMTKKQKEK